MFRGLSKYKTAYHHLWQTYGSSWLVRASFTMQVATRLIKLIVLPVILSLIITNISTQNFTGAYYNVLVFVGSSLTLGIITPITKYIGMLGENKIYRTATADYFNRLINTDIDYFNSNLAGYLTTATRQYVDSGVILVRSLREKYMGTILSIVFPLCVIFWVDRWLGATTLILSLILTFYLLWASNAIAPLRTRAREAYKQNSGRMADIISNILAVRSTAQEAMYTEEVKQGANDEALLFTQRYTLQAKLIAVREFITVTFFMVLLWQTVQRISDGHINITAAVLVVTYTTTILTGIYSLSENLDEHDDLIDKIIPAFEILNRRNAVTDPQRPKALGTAKGNIQLSNIHFAYDKNQPVLKDFFLSIPAGQKLGIVGLSGAGKSTLAKLLLRFNDIDQGQILLDGIDIRQLKQSALRQQIAYVPQEPLLFHASIKQNVLLGDPNATTKQIEHALHTAHALHFIQQLPDGIDSIVGERGVKLSGGQKQRVAIARAVLRQTPIMILDEATSALDSESEQIIKDSFKHILKGKTAIVIAHRLSTLSEMDRIVVIEKGKCLEDGTHEQLLAQNGIYARLWRRQLKHIED